MDFSYLRQNNKSIKFTVNDYKKLFEKYEHNPPSLQESLYQMFKSSNLDDKNIELFINEIMDKCKECIDSKMNEINKKFKKITKDDAYIICSYTVDIKDPIYNPYKLLNKYLSNPNKNEIIKISKYLYILLKSLRKLPRYYPDNKYLYRCIRQHVPIKEDPFNKELVPFVVGNKKTFYGFISTNPNPKIAYSYLGIGGRQSGTIFTLGGDVWGYDIELFNYFLEKEILLEPGVSFIVENVIPSLNNIININCKVINIDEKNIFQDESLIKNEEKRISEADIKQSKDNLDKNNESYLTEVKKLKEELKKLKIQNENLQLELSKAQKIIKNFANNQIDNNELKNLKLENENLKIQLINKDKEIKDLKANIIERPKYDINDIMVINFVSLDSTVHYGIKCVSTDVFAEVEEKLYKIYDDLRNTNNMFTANAKPVLRFKKICENNIKDGDVVQLFKLE